MDSSTPPEHRLCDRLSDGRRLAWSEWGTPSGLPVVFCTGAGMSGRLGFGVDCLAPLGARLMGIDRPGLGRSDADAAKSLTTWTADVRELLDALPRAVAVGFSQGSPFALALAAAGLVEAVAIVSGQDELAHPRVYPLLSEPVARMVAEIQRDPEAFTASFAAVASPEGIWQLVMQTSGERDRAVYRQPGFAAAFRECLDEGFAQGPAGYLRDLVIACQRWPFSVEDIRVPVHLWYGRLDTSPVHAPDFGATLAGRLPGATLTIDPDEGSSILWTRAEAILRQLLGR